MTSTAVATHQPCPTCGSSDAATVYDDGHLHCFSCGFHGNEDGAHSQMDDLAPAKQTKERTKTGLGLLTGGKFQALTARALNADTCRKFGYTINSMPDHRIVQVAPYFDDDGIMVAQKIRDDKKNFLIAGDFSRATLFGQRLWAKGGKRLVITEGEIDALSYAQATNLAWPVVSVPNGAEGALKSILKNLEWIESFETVVFLLDNDDAGRKAARKCAETLTPGKAKIATLPLKDANDMLKAGKIKELCEAVDNAAEVRPDGIINANTLWDMVRKPVKMGIPYPWKGLNKMLFGLRPREIITFGSGSGSGKSTITAEIAYALAQARKENVGYVALEEGVDRTARRLMSIYLNKPIHLPNVQVAPDELERAFQATCGTGRYNLYDHFGSLDSTDLLNKLRYMIKGLGCRWLVLDHLSIVVSGMDFLDPRMDERKEIDRTMTKLRQLTEETDAGLLLVSHLRRLDGNSGHEDGAKVSLSHFRGSQAIVQLSDVVIGAERNLQAKDELDRNTVTLRVLKNRYAGLTGEACTLYYNSDTGRLQECGEIPDDSDDQKNGSDF